MTSEADIQRAIIEALLFDGWMVLRINQGGAYAITDALEVTSPKKRYITFANWQMLGQEQTDKGICDILAVKPVDYGYFTGDAERNSQGVYLGRDIYGGSHYGLNTTKIDFSGSFWSNSCGVEIGKKDLFFMLEYRSDNDKKDGNIDFSADQMIAGIGFGW